jgi:phosphatidylserine decarboxylase
LSDNTIISPADGTVVAIEDIEENEFFKEPRTQISVFMSVWSVHINWFPTLGKVMKTEHFSGRYMAAWLPKSSTENERALTMIKPNKAEPIVIRQIAGAVARRIITYTKPDQEIQSLNHLGFIRFGSRVDVLLPKNYKPTVELNQKVKGGLSELAVLEE